MKPEVIMNGSKIISLTAYNVRIIDSLSFLNMSLSTFPKTFELHEMAKGWFSFWANNREYQHYIEPYLPLEYYKPESMSPDNREKFLKLFLHQFRLYHQL